MPRILARLSILLVLPAFTLAADCTAPEPPTDLPDGKTAGKEAMIEGQQTVRTYVQEGDDYVACMDQAAEAVAAEVQSLKQNEDADQAMLEEREAKVDEIIRDRNEVVSQMKDIADAFNAEIDEYQAQASDES